VKIFRDFRPYSLRRGLLGCSSLAVFAVTLAFTAADATAGTFYDACRPDPGNACRAAERHTYNSNYTETQYGADYYLCSWLKNPSTGTDINVKCGNGSAGSFYRSNTDVYLDGYFGNYDARGPVYIRGVFGY